MILSPEILDGFRSEEEDYRAISDQILLADYLCNYGKV